jgi:hypothetical protein
MMLPNLISVSVIPGCSAAAAAPDSSARTDIKAMVRARVMIILPGWLWRCADAVLLFCMRLGTAGSASLAFTGWR